MSHRSIRGGLCSASARNFRSLTSDLFKIVRLPISTLSQLHRSKSWTLMSKRVNREVLPHFEHVRFPPNRVENNDRKDLHARNSQRCRV